MVSIRRRRLLALYSGKNYSQVGLPKSDSGSATDDLTPNSKSAIVNRLPIVDASPPKDVITSTACPSSPTMSASSSSKEEKHQPFLVKEVKRRKRHRRKLFQDQEPCLMRGVYFKNMKWQAAIKVDKKQIHLGTVGSQEEAARLYDRAAFMCGREPNFELSEEEKQELRQFKWDEFLAVTRNAITKKKHRRRLGAGARKDSGPPLQSGEWDDEQVGVPAAEDGEPDSSAS